MSAALVGLLVWCTRPGRAGERSCRRLHDQGARVLHAPTLRIDAVVPPPGEMRRLREIAGEAVVALTSPTSTAHFVAALGVGRPDGSPWPVVAVGEKTALRARELGLELLATAPRATASDLAPALLEASGAGTVIVPGSNLRRAELAAALEDAGRRVVPVTVQETIPGDALPGGVAERLDEVDLILAYSPSALEFVGALDDALRRSVLRIPVAVMGRTSGRRARELGFTVAVEPEDPGEDRLLALIQRWHRDGA